MSNEREIADITLQLLANAEESTQNEQGRMPSAALTSRFRYGPPGSSGVPTQTSSQHQYSHQIGSEITPSDRENDLGGGETQCQGSYEHRGRHKSFTDAASAAHGQLMEGAPKRSALPPTVATTETMKKLSTLPIRRAWNASADHASSGVSQTLVQEAIMLHERGEVQTPEQQCSKCRRGEGISPECIKISGIHNGVCSNCLMTLAFSRPGLAARAIRSYSAERRSISATMSPSIPKEDLIAVWNLIAGVISRQPQECFFDDGSEPSGKRIEDAARLVARSADEWGHNVKEEGPDPGKTPKTPSERSKLARQATRIRETALQIAECAKDWGEKLERKRSSSQLRK